MGPGALARVLRPLSLHHHPDLLVGLQTSDDAAVFRLSADQAIIETVDFFPPVVDDPFTYGAIAATNSMSDIYAMGGEVLFALNIAAFPDDLPLDILAAIFAGGAAKVTEAGGVIAGGHTVSDPEPKYGLAVTGLIHPDRVLTKAGAQAGDRLYLTKPLGTGVITTAIKEQAATPEDERAAIASMLTLNRAAARLAGSVGVHACTDITGFGLLGHAAEMAHKSGVRPRLVAHRVPLLPGARDAVAAGHVPGGLDRNRAHFSVHPDGGVAIATEVPEDLEALLWDPETSGGLLLAAAPSHLTALEAAFAAETLPLWPIGEVLAGAGIDVVP